MKLLLCKILRRSTLAVTALLIALPSNAQEVMWGSSSQGNDPGSLYTIDPSSGVATLVGSTGLLDDIGRPHKISAIAVDPMTGTIYGMAGSACTGAELITIDPSTGAGTVVGPVVGMGFDGSDSSGSGINGAGPCIGGSDALAFTADGTLYAGGWNGGTIGGKLLVINKHTGAVLANYPTDIIAPATLPAHIAGLATAPDGATLWVSRGNNTPGTLHTIDPLSGAFTSTLVLSDSGAILSDITIASDGTFFASNPSAGKLVTVDVVSGLVTEIGLFGGGAKISGLTSVIVEVDAEDCATVDGCNPTGGQTIILPETVVIPPGSTLTQIGLRQTDPRVTAGTCGVAGLTVDIPDTANDLFIPPFLCGTPDFVVLATEAPDLDFLDGVVTVENEPGIFFADPLDCIDPIPVGTDPQEQDVVVWQPTVAADVYEVRALELTDGCGSSRGSTRGLSYFVVGMAINFGLDHVTEAEDLRQAFIGLTTMKFDALGQVLKNARTSLVSPRYGALRSQWSSANDNFQIGNYDKALQRLDKFIARVEAAEFDTSSGFNHRGNLLMRARNIRFMIEAKVVPFAP